MLSGIDRVLLTGFRATGKSRVGKILADLLGMDFFDTDALICRRNGTTVAGLVSNQGWEAFRRQEKELLAELSHGKGFVLATGGGAIIHTGEWDLLRQGGFSVWLRAEAATIERRLQADADSKDQRPSLTGKDPGLEILELLEKRTPLYRAGSDFSVQTDNRTPEELARIIMEKLAGSSGNGKVDSPGAGRLNG